VVISWVLGACALDAAVITLLSKEASMFTIAADWRAALWLFAALIPTSALGYFLGMFTCWPLVRVICCRYNLAPLKAGHHVMVLSGPQKGITAEVCEITVGQGGWNLARLDIGEERCKKFNDLFEEYSLLKVNGEPGVAPTTSVRWEQVPRQAVRIRRRLTRPGRENLDPGLPKPWKSGDTAIPLTPALSRGRGSRIVRPERSTGFPRLRVSVRRDQES